jgi:hypothetical protein
MDKNPSSDVNCQDTTEKYSINESLLQSYRQIFISSESFLLAVGTLALEQDIAVFLIVAIVSIIIIWPGWFEVVKFRHRIVDYYKFSVEHETGISLKDYINNAKIRKTANQIIGKELGEKGNWRPTRKKIDCMLPVMFTLVWLVLIGSYRLESGKTIAGLLLDGLRMIIQ